MPPRGHAGILRLAPLDPTAVRVLLCDADGTLFDSEGPAFAASAAVANRLLATLGSDRRFNRDELRRRSTGQSFRSIARALAAETGVPIEHEALEAWVREERRAVGARLGSVLRPDSAVLRPLGELASRFRLALVSSSAGARLSASLRATGLDDLFPRERRFSAEDSLPVPRSKPDPAIYALAGRRLGVEGGAALAVEDAAVGARAAIAAGFPTVGTVQFVAPGERPARIAALGREGVAAIVSSWSQLAALLATDPGAGEPLEAAGGAP